jgi:DNA-binding transcriptional regulator YdaS (Cro superfamily)
VKLSEWIDKKVSATRSRTSVRQELATISGVSFVTVTHVDSGMRLKSYEKAKALSDATGGKVSTEELCE